MKECRYRASQDVRSHLLRFAVATGLSRDEFGGFTRSEITSGSKVSNGVLILLVIRALLGMLLELKALRRRLVFGRWGYSASHTLALQA